MSEFLQMGGYALYVWGAYGVTLVVLVALLAEAITRLRRRQAELTRLEEHEP
jgi:heme exporter protein D